MRPGHQACSLSSGAKPGKELKWVVSNVTSTCCDFCDVRLSSGVEEHPGEQCVLRPGQQARSLPLSHRSPTRSPNVFLW